MVKSPPIAAASLPYPTINLTMATSINPLSELGRMIGSFGVTPTQAMLAFSRINSIRNGGMSEDSFNLGIVPRITIHMASGETLDIEDTELEMLVTTETLDHYAMASNGRREVTHTLVGEERKVVIKNANPELAEELIRLIRDD